jgi:hypothetical protein
MQTVTSTDQIVETMVKMVRKFATDMDFCLDWSVEGVFIMLSHLPYVVEPRELNTQILQRPSLTLAHGPVKACANKAICMASWCHRKGYPWQFAVSANTKDGPFSHVFTVAKIEDVRVPLDCTYFWNVVGDERKHARTKYYDWEKPNAT